MPAPLQIDVQREGRRFDAQASLVLAASAATVWDTITDYPNLPRFMPGIRQCRVTERHTARAGLEHLVLEQEGEFRLLVLAQRMAVLLDVTHQDQRIAEAKARSVDLGLLRRHAIDRFEGRYEIDVVDDNRRRPQVQLRYTALIQLRLPPPPAVGSVAVRQNLAAQLVAVGAEVARRAAGTA